MNENNYNSKYLKYKKKYLREKKNLVGGAPMNINICIFTTGISLYGYAYDKFEIPINSDNTVEDLKNELSQRLLLPKEKINLSFKYLSLVSGRKAPILLNDSSLNDVFEINIDGQYNKIKIYGAGATGGYYYLYITYMDSVEDIKKMINIKEKRESLDKLYLSIEDNGAYHELTQDKLEEMRRLSKDITRIGLVQRV